VDLNIFILSLLLLMIVLDYTTANLSQHRSLTLALGSLEFNFSFPARTLPAFTLGEPGTFPHRDFLDGKEVQAVG